MKKQLSSLETAALVKEFQILIGSKIDQIYQPNKKEFLISIHIPRKGKQFLKIELPNFIYLSQQKLEMPPPSEFCLTLRRFLNNSIIKKVSQINTERIIEITLQKEKQFKLIIELFSKGNLLLTDQKNQILALQERQRWGERELKIKEIFHLPPASFNYFKSSLQELKNIIKKTKKNKIITCLATEIGLGGTYSEEICCLTKINKSQLPKQTTDDQIKEIFKTIKDFIKKIETPVGIVYKLKDVTPFPFQTYQDLNKKEFPTFNQALDAVLSKQSYEIEIDKKQAKYQEKIKKIKHILKEQEETIKKLQQEETINTQKANYIYEKYQEINSFLKKINQAKKSMSWEQIKKELKQHQQIKNINLKEKKILLKI